MYIYIYTSTVARLPSKGRQVSEGFQNRESVTPIVGGVISYWIDSLKKLKPLWLYDSCRNQQVLFMCFHWSVCEACALHTLILCKQWHHFAKKSTVLACSFSGSDGSGLMLGPKFAHVPSFSIWCRRKCEASKGTCDDLHCSPCFMNPCSQPIKWSGQDNIWIYNWIRWLLDVSSFATNLILPTVEERIR